MSVPPRGALWVSTSSSTVREEAVVGGKRNLDYRFAGKDDQSHVVAGEFFQQVADVGFRPPQPVGRHVFGQHGPGNVQADKAIHAALDDFFEIHPEPRPCAATMIAASPKITNVPLIHGRGNLSSGGISRASIDDWTNRLAAAARLRWA